MIVTISCEAVAAKPVPLMVMVAPPAAWLSNEVIATSGWACDTGKETGLAAAPVLEKVSVADCAAAVVFAATEKCTLVTPAGPDVWSAVIQVAVVGMDSAQATLDVTTTESACPSGFSVRGLLSTMIPGVAPAWLKLTDWLPDTPLPLTVTVACKAFKERFAGKER